jgi:ATP synthase protein I
MANDARAPGDGEGPPNEEAELTARLHRLGERLDRVRPEAPPAQAPPPATDSSALARGFRLSSELVAAVLVGAAIGWLIDRWLGISPWGMIVFLLLGFAAGVLNVMRAAGVVPPNRMDPPS